MILNNIQKVDFYKGLKQVSYLMTSFDTDHLDIKGVENRIQQTLGVLNLLEKLQIEEEGFRKVMINTLKDLYRRKKELRYGYEEDYTKELTAVPAVN